MSPEDEMMEGYRDGRDPNAPAPSANRSESYRHGFQNARDDRAGRPRARPEDLRRQAEEAMEADRCR